jgi:hypothetical protein
VHLNVPADGDSSLTVVLRKIKWMMAAILAPEYTATHAFRDWLLARAWKEKLKLWSSQQNDQVSTVQALRGLFAFCIEKMLSEK